MVRLVLSSNSNNYSLQLWWIEKHLNAHKSNIEAEDNTKFHFSATNRNLKQLKLLSSFVAHTVGSGSCYCLTGMKPSMVFCCCNLPILFYSLLLHDWITACMCRGKPVKVICECMTQWTTTTKEYRCYAAASGWY